MAISSSLLAAVLALAPSVLAAEWQVLYPNVMTIAIGVSAPDASNIYVSGANDGTGAAILKSEDAGQTWSSLPHDPQMMYMDVDVAKRTTFGGAAGVAMFGMTSGSSFTQDGGEFHSTPDTPFFAASQNVAAVDGSTFYMVGGWQESVRDVYHNGVYGTSDGAASMVYHDWGFSVPARYGAFPSNSTWFVTGGSWPASASASASPKEWRELTPRVRVHRDGLRASFEVGTAGEPRSAEGYVGVIARTQDGGKTFEMVFNETGRLYFNAIDCPSETHCWAVAEGPAGAWIFSTADSGRSWDEQYFEASAGLFDVKMISTSEGWAVGGSFSPSTFSALFLHTTDGGKTWTNANTLSNAYPNAITVVSQDRAYATAFLRNGLSSILVYA